MKALVWLCTVGSVVAVGCSSSDKTPQADNSSKAIAQALIAGADFTKGTVKSGSLPETTAEDVAVAPDTQALTLKPSGAAIMSLDVDNPDEATNPVKATLIQFDMTDKHVEVPRMEGDAGSGTGQSGKVHLENPFKLDTDICKDFCNKSFQVKMLMAVMLDDGKISQHAERSFTLDCSKDGDKNKCSTPDAGTKGTGGKGSTVKDAGARDGGADNSLGEKLGVAYLNYNLAICGCNTGSSNGYCGADGTFTKTQIACIKAAVNANLDSSGKNAKASCDLGAINTYVASCKSSCTTCSQQGLGDALRKESSSCRMMSIPGMDACMIPLGDAGMLAKDGGVDSGMKP